MKPIAIAAALLMLAGPALARGNFPPGAEHDWWECWHQPDNIGPYGHVSCCSESDGHTLQDDDWRVNPATGTDYQVRVEGKWFDVPPKSVIRSGFAECGPEPNLEHRSQAKVWYSRYNGMNGEIKSITIYCFLVGTLA